MAEPDRRADEILGSLMGALEAGLDDTGAAAGEGLLRIAVAARGVWDVLGDLARLGAVGTVTLETTLSAFVLLLPADARAALGVVDDPGEPDPLTVTYDLAERVARVSVPRATLRGLSFGGATVAALSAEDVRICVTGPFDALTVVFSAGGVRAEGLALARRTVTTVGAVEAHGMALEIHDLAPDPARIDDPERPLRAVLTVARGAVGELGHERLVAGALEADDLRVDLEQAGGRVGLTVARGTARALEALGATVAAGSATGLEVSVRDPGGRLPLLSRRPEQPEVELAVERIEGADLTARQGRARSASAGPIRAMRAEGRVRIEADRAGAEGITGAVTTSSSTEAPAALPAWVRAAGAAIREVDATGRLLLPTAHLGIGPAAVDIEPGTHAEARVVVRDGRVDAAATHLGFDRPLDGPLWTDIRGATLTEDGRAKVEVDGFPDPDVTRIVAWVLDLPERRIPLEVAELSALVADRLAAGGGPALPGSPEVTVEADAKRIVTGALGLTIGHARIEIGSGEVDSARVRIEGREVRGEVMRAAGERLVILAAERARPVPAANEPPAEPPPPIEDPTA